MGFFINPQTGRRTYAATVFSTEWRKKNQEFFRCANYKDGRGSCSIHYIREVVFETIVKDAVSELADFVRCYESVLLYLQAQKHSEFEKNQVKKLTPAVVNKLIQRIEIHKNEKKHSHGYVKVDICFIAVGLVDMPTEQQQLKTIHKIKEDNTAKSA